MKLRLAAYAVRLRILRSELETLKAGGSLRETVRLAPGPSGCIVYALSLAEPEENRDLQVFCNCGEVRITVSKTSFDRWCEPKEVGIYAHVEVAGDKPLRVVIEKDFACLDSSEADNRDTFENPHAGNIC